MKFYPIRVLNCFRVFKSKSRCVLACAVAISCAFASARGAESKAEPAWRSLPLIANGKVDDAWSHVGWGGFVVDDGALRTECDPKGLGLLVYKKEKFGNCQLRVVFKTKATNSNSGVYVRIADGILDQIKQPGAAFNRDAAGKISDDTRKNMM